MAKKIMLWPSARSKYVKADNMLLIYRSLLVLSIIMIFLNYYMFGFMYGVKLLLMILVSVVLTTETEILFYTIDKDITRQESKKLIEKSFPKITALIYVLLIPLGTPLWLVGLGAVLATLLGKLLFGGFHHMVFHTSLVGVILVTLGWPGLGNGVPFSTAFDNYLIELLFGGNFFQETLSIGNAFLPSATPLLESIRDVVTGSLIPEGGGVTEYTLTSSFLGLVPGVIGSAFALLVIGGFLLYKKAINWVTPVSMIGSFIAIAIIIALVKNIEMSYVLYQLFGGSFLFVVLFIATDPITSPIDSKGKVIYGVIAGALTMLIRNAGTHVEGVYFAVGFMMMLTPMLNTFFKAKKPVKKAPVIKEAN